MVFCDVVIKHDRRTKCLTIASHNEYLAIIQRKLVVAYAQAESRPILGRTRAEVATVVATHHADIKRRMREKPTK